ncbi:MAG: HNH endonuclease [bacterium]|nr:HNH endonuclease [Acidimicrobiia bacterium]MCY4650588.1 HNH endonuclease [bacterium]
MTKALVLNATHEPLSVVSSRRALVLVWRKRATVMEVREELWHSAERSFVVPSVVRLNYYVKVPYHRTVPLTRRAVFGRDGNLCQYCGGDAESLDHVVPRSRGGAHSWDNVVACCRRCNIKKGNRLLNEVGFALLRSPRFPRRFGWVYTSSGYRVDPSWKPYLLADSA